MDDSRAFEEKYSRWHSGGVPRKMTGSYKVFRPVKLWNFYETPFEKQIKVRRSIIVFKSVTVSKLTKLIVLKNSVTESRIFGPKNVIWLIGKPGNGRINSSLLAEEADNSKIDQRKSSFILK